MYEIGIEGMAGMLSASVRLAWRYAGAPGVVGSPGTGTGELPRMNHVKFTYLGTCSRTERYRAQPSLGLTQDL